MLWRRWLTGCSRCNSDLSLERDQHGTYVASCKACGAVTWAVSAQDLIPEPVEREPLSRPRDRYLKSSPFAGAELRG